jgi:hypothetical protein
MVVSDSVGCLFSISRIDSKLSAPWNTTPFLYPHTTPECTESVAGVMVSIVAFQAVDPGSIPGPRNFFLSFWWGVVLCVNVGRVWMLGVGVGG